MTEIPEHLLKRSRERRSALGLGGDDAGSTDTPAANAPATTTPAAAPAAAAPAGPVGRAAAAPEPAAPAPKPDSPVVAAYKKRSKVPFWAMAALGFLPVWGFMYARAVTAQPVEAAGPMAIGEDTYSKCSSCHGGTGEGVGSAPGFSDGQIFATFPHIEDQVRWVYYGTAAYNLAGVESYGNPDRPGGARITGSNGVMPQWGADAGGELTDAEILGVVCHERFALGGQDAAGEEFEKWCSEESELFAALEDGSGSLATLHELDDTIVPIGDGPVPGLPPAAEG